MEVRRQVRRSHPYLMRASWAVPSGRMARCGRPAPPHLEDRDTFPVLRDRAAPAARAQGSPPARRRAVYFFTEDSALSLNRN